MPQIADRFAAARAARKGSYEGLSSPCEPQDMVECVGRMYCSLGKRLYLLSGAARPACQYGSISLGPFGWICVHVAARLALSASERAIGRPGRFRPGDLPRAPAPSPPSTPLH